MSGFQNSFDAAEAAAGHAERVKEGWREDALNAFRVFAMRNLEFASEQVRMFAEDLASPYCIGSPPDPRAWGAVAREAKRKGYVTDTGRYKDSKSPTRHTTKVAVLRSLMYGWPA